MAAAKKETLSKFLKEGHQLDSEALDYFTKNPNKVDVFLETIKNISKTKDRKTTITTDYILSVLSTAGLESKPEEEIKIIKKFSTDRKEEKIDVEKYMSMYSERYENMRKILLEKMSNLKVISINKIQKQPNFSLIAMVREKDIVDKTLLVEDPTGDVVVCVEEENTTNTPSAINTIIEDDVLGFVCERSEERIKIKQTIWPDIPLKRKINKTEDRVKCLFLSGSALTQTQHKTAYKRLLEWLEKVKFEKFYVFVLDGPPSSQEDLDEFLSRVPGSFKIFVYSKEHNNATPLDNKNRKTIMLRESAIISIKEVTIFLMIEDLLNNYGGVWPDANEIDIMINLLKRGGNIGIKDPLFLDVVPDIIAVPAFGAGSSSNYKGTTIVSMGEFTTSPIIWIADLKSREINKLNFS